MKEDFESIKSDLINVENIKDIKNNPIVKVMILPLLKSIPIIGEVLDNSIDLELANFQQKKRDEFLEILIDNNHKITSEMVNDIEFIIHFTKILEAVNRLAANSKVKYFASLLKNAHFKSERIENCEFEELFECLTTLSYRQIQILSILYEIENNPKLYINQDIKENSYLPELYWSNFKKILQDRLKIQSDEVFGIMKSLEKTGLFAMFNGFTFGKVEEGELTYYGRNFIKKVCNY